MDKELDAKDGDEDNADDNGNDDDDTSYQFISLVVFVNL